jgi:hypothetical protein
MMCVQVVIAKIQEITLFEWLPALGITPGEVFLWEPRTAALRATSAISNEFLITYRWGHGAIPNTIGGFQIAQIFDSESFYGVTSAAGTDNPTAANTKLDNLLSATAREAMADMDGEMADSVRNALFGSLDLASFNIFRSREIALPSYANLARCYGVTPRPEVRGFSNLASKPGSLSICLLVSASRVEILLCLEQAFILEHCTHIQRETRHGTL